MIKISIFLVSFILAHISNYHELHYKQMVKSNLWLKNFLGKILYNYIIS